MVCPVHIYSIYICMTIIFVNIPDSRYICSQPLPTDVYCVCFQQQQQRVEFVTVSYRDNVMRRKYVDYMPLHWIDGDILYFPPEGKSEAAAQVVNRATWRKYHISRSYFNTRTFSRNDAEQKTNKLRKQEEQEAGESTDTSDLAHSSRRLPYGKSPRKSPRIKSTMSKPPSAPKMTALNSRRKLLLKPPPSLCLLDKGNKKRLRSSPTTSEDEEQDPSWKQPVAKIVRKKRQFQPMDLTPTEVVFAEEPETSTTSPEVQLPQQSVTTATPMTCRQHSEVTTSPAVQLPQQSLTTATPMTEPQQQAPTSAGLAQVLHQLTKISRQLDNFSNQFADVKQRMVTMEKLFHERLQSSSEATVAEVLTPAVGGEQLDDEERCILRRNPLVTNDQQWEELEAILVDSGRHGAFFHALVRTITERIIDRSDAHKTANATLRALVAESYLAERVTMAGYKKCKILQYFGFLLCT